MQEITNLVSSVVKSHYRNSNIHSVYAIIIIIIEIDLSCTLKNNVSYANVHEINGNEKFQYFNIMFIECSYALVDLDDENKEDEQYCLVDLSLPVEDNRDDNTAKVICCSYRCTDCFTQIQIEHVQKLFSNKSRED